jgi:hypothetical protein
MGVGARQAKAGSFHGIVRDQAIVGQLPLEKCTENARANEPKPPRVTLPEPESEAVPDDVRLAEVSPPKKLLRDQYPPDEPWPPLPDDDPRGAQSAPDGGWPGAAIPGDVGAQLPLGIIA